MNTEKFQALLEGFRLRIGGSSLEPGQRLTVSSSSFRHDPVVVLPGDPGDLPEIRASARAAAEALGLEPSDIDLIVMVSTPYLRLLDVVHQSSLHTDDALPDQLILNDGQARALQTASGGCDVDVCFVLNADREPRPLKPSRKGTWLGRVKFALRTELGELGFTPRALTDDIRNQFQLPADAVRYVEIVPDGLRGDDLQSAVELYLDQELLSLLNKSTSTAGARALQRQLFVDVFAAIVREVGRPDFGELAVAMLTEETVLSRVIDAAAGKAPHGESAEDKQRRREQALDLLKHQPELFMARIEAATGPREDLRRIITGVDE